MVKREEKQYKYAGLTGSIPVSVGKFFELENLFYCL